MADSSNNESRIPILIVLAMLVIAIVVGIMIFFVEKDKTPLMRLTIFAGYLVLILVFAYGLLTLYAMASGKIDLQKLVSESDGSASMSRFQLLIFTFVIALSIVMMVVSANPPKFPAIPNEVLILLGISASTYAVSKGIQTGADADQATTTNPPPPPPPPGGDDKAKGAGAGQ
jgi:hypothetical protein